MKLFSADIKDLHALYIQHLQKALDMENTIVEKGLPALIAGATDSQLISGLKAHLGESKIQADRLTSILSRHTGEASPIKCPAVHTLVSEGGDGIQDAGNSVIRDITIIAAGREVEHHEIAVYGTLRAWAALLGYDQDVALLTESLAEEKASDKKLSVVSDSVNIEGETAGA